MPRGVYDRSAIVPYVRTPEFRARLSQLAYERTPEMRAQISLRSRRHDMVGTGVYWTWRAMKDRCLYPKSRAYPRYGGRGITICERWLVFENFYADMGDRPEGLTLDRIDNDGNYEPGNCRWATRREQALNRVNNGASAGGHARAAKLRLAKAQP